MGCLVLGESRRGYLFASWSACVQQGDHEGFLEVLLAVNAFLFKVEHDGWQQFIDRLGINGRWLVAANYSGSLLDLAEDNLLAEAPDADYVQQVLEQSTRQPVNELVTAEARARYWWRLFRKVCREPKR